MSSFMSSIKRMFGVTEKSTRTDGSVALAASPQPTMTPTGYIWKPAFGNGIGPHDSYDDLFPYTNAIAQRFSTVIPYAVDQDGNVLDNPVPPAIQALYRPNDTYSCLQFLKFIASTILTQSHLDILIWTQQGRNIVPGHGDGEITPDNIVGYTPLPLGSREYNNSRTDYIHRVTMPINGMDQPMEFSRDETIALSYSQHPEDPTRGISPAMTVHKWASLNDCIADFEQGFFDNGAVPGGMLSIVAESRDDFERTKRRLEDSFRGAGNNNGVLYNYVPVDPQSNQPSSNAKLAWQPFQQSNNQLDLSTLDDLVMNRLSGAMGVPDIVRGIDDSQTYANAQMAERSFIENTLKPLLMNVWDMFQFELDRITGGLGYGITFTLDLPAQTDVESIQANTQSTQVATLLSLVNAGASVKTAVQALGLPDEYAALELSPDGKGETQQNAQPVTNIVVNGGQNGESRQDAAKQTEPVDDEDTTEEDPQAEPGSDYAKVLDVTRTMYRSLVSVATGGKFSLEDDMKRIAVEWVDGTYAILEDRIRRYARKNGVTLKQAVMELADTDPDVKAAIDGMGQQEWAGLYDWDTLPERFRTAYMERLKLVANDATKNGYNAIQDVLAKAHDEEWTADHLMDELTNLVDGFRAARLARNETVNSERLGALFSARNMADDLGIEMAKVWTAVATNPCPFCSSMDGKTIGLDDVFMKEGESVDIDGHEYVNTFADKDTCDGHPNCRCVLTYKVIGMKK